jgi:hypothetical protein
MPLFPEDDATDGQLTVGGDSGVNVTGPEVQRRNESPHRTSTNLDEPVGESGAFNSIDDAEDANGNLTVDFGFMAVGEYGIGNLVFEDRDGSGSASPNEGVNGVTVQLYFEGQDPAPQNCPLIRKVTSGGGTVPVLAAYSAVVTSCTSRPSQFSASGPLRGNFSLEGIAVGDDDAGEDTLDEPEPWVTGLTTRVIDLDAHARSRLLLSVKRHRIRNAMTHRMIRVDLTVDIGVFRPVGIGNLVFQDSNGNGRADSGEGLNGVTLNLIRVETNGETLVASTVSANGGRYLFMDLRAGNYFVQIPASEFSPGGPLNGKVSVPEGLAGDDDVGEDGIDVFNPEVVGIRSPTTAVSAGQAPTDQNGETGTDAASDNDLDAAIDLTVDFGFQNPVGLGNMVFMDANGNNVFDVGEGVDGVTVDLYRQGQIPGAGLPIFSTTTSNGGRFFFNYLSIGSYFVHIPPSEFGENGPLVGALSLNGVQAGDDDLGEDGIDDPTPAVNGIRTGLVCCLTMVRQSIQIQRRVLTARRTILTTITMTSPSTLASRAVMKMRSALETWCSKI